MIQILAIDKTEAGRAQYWLVLFSLLYSFTESLVQCPKNASIKSKRVLADTPEGKKWLNQTHTPDNVLFKENTQITGR